MVASTLTVGRDVEDRIVILGAGASYGARADDCRPPLGVQLANYLRDWNNWWGSHPPDEFEQLREEAIHLPSPEVRDPVFLVGLDRFLNAACVDGFEVAATRALDDSSPDQVDLGALSLLLAQAMLLDCEVSRFPQQKDLLDDLLTAFGIRNAALDVITLNYDLLLEEAALRVLARIKLSDAVSYSGVSESAGALRLWKIHGSVNWLRSNSHIAGSRSEPVTTRPAKPSSYNGKLIGLDTGGIDPPPDTRDEVLQQMRHDSEGARRPVVAALYSVGKPIPNNPSVLHAVREDALDLFRRKPDAEVIVIGVRPPPIEEDDPTLSLIFEAVAKHRGPTSYVGPCEQDRAAVARLGVTPGARGLHELLNSSRRLIPGGCRHDDI
jgi:hypothetical protein